MTYTNKTYLGWASTECTRSVQRGRCCIPVHHVAGARRPVVRLLETINGKKKYKTVFDGFPPLPPCGFSDSLARFEWWQELRRCAQRTMFLGVDLEWLFGEISKEIPMPTEEDELAYTLYLGMSKPACPGDLKRNIEAAMDAAAHVFRPDDETWRYANAAWIEALSVSHDLDQFNLAREAAFGLAADAIEAEQQSRRCRATKIAEWETALAGWREVCVHKANGHRESDTPNANNPRKGHARSAGGGGSVCVSPYDRVKQASHREVAAMLGLPDLFTSEHLKVAYCAAVFKHHPDRGGDPAMLVAVMLAYRRLTARFDPVGARI